MYADDLAIWTRNICPKEAEKILNERLQALSGWTNCWRIRLAPEKSVSVVFSRRPTQRRQSINLQLLGKPIERLEEHKFLGVTYDSRLTWKKHISNIVNGVTSRTHALKRLAAKSAHENPRWITKLHEALINSVWKYGSVAYCSMSNAMWEKLRKCHAHCVKAYTGVPNYTSYSLVCDTLGVKEIRDEICSFAKKRLISMIRFSPLGQTIIKRDTSTPTIYKSVSDVLLEDVDLQLLQQTTTTQ